MSSSILFWIIFIIAFVFGGLGFNRTPEGRWTAGFSLVLWVLLGLLGWRVFGAPIR